MAMTGIFFPSYFPPSRSASYYRRISQMEPDTTHTIICLNYGQIYASATCRTLHPHVATLPMILRVPNNTRISQRNCLSSSTSPEPVFPAFSYIPVRREGCMRPSSQMTLHLEAVTKSVKPPHVKISNLTS